MSSLDVWFTDYDFLLLSSGRERKQRAKILFHNTRHLSRRPWAGYTGRRKSLFPCQSRCNAIPHTLTSVQPAGGPSQGGEATMAGGEEWPWKTSPTVKRKICECCCHRWQNTAGCSLGRPNVFAIEFGENTFTHAPCNWKNTIICFSLLRNLLSCFQLHTPPVLLSILPSFPLSSLLQCFLQVKLKTNIRYWGLLYIVWLLFWHRPATSICV